MKHLEDVNMGYFEHLFHAWRMSVMLFIHGLFPMIWSSAVSDEMLDHHNSVEKKIWNERQNNQL